MKKICFVAQFPPPMHGLSKAVETLYNSNIRETYELSDVNITNNKNILKNIRELKNSDADLFYYTISQSILGNLRDLILLKIIVKKKKKCVIHLHGGYYRILFDSKMRSFQRRANRKMLSNIDGAIVLGNSLKKIFEGLVDDSKIFVVPNCVDEQFLISQEEYLNKNKKQKEEGIREVLYLSNFIESKGYKDVLALAQIEKQKRIQTGITKYHFNFAGLFFDSKDKDNFIKYINENELQDVVTYYGVVGGKDKLNLLEISDVFVLLTRYPKEGQPISILEAMGNGMFIITTDHAGIPDIVDCESGIIANKTTTIHEIYQKLSDMDVELPRITNRNREMVKNKYTEEIYIENCRSVFDRVIN